MAQILGVTPWRNFSPSLIYEISLTRTVLYCIVNFRCVSPLKVDLLIAALLRALLFSKASAKSAVGHKWGNILAGKPILQATVVRYAGFVTDQGIGSANFSLQPNFRRLWILDKYC